MKYYIIAGEASGDLHGSNLMKGLYAEDQEAVIRFWGGDLMDSVYQANEKPGEKGRKPACCGGLVRHYRDCAVMGLVEVLTKAGKLLGNIRKCKQDILDWKPDAVILIDYPGFNFKIAGFTHKKGIPTYYYIAPKVWASREGRIRKLRKFIDRLYIIFPFEIPYFKARNVEAIYLGNPLTDAIAGSKAMNETREEFLKRNSLDDRPFIAMLAGSRKGEISTMMPVLTEFAEKLHRIPQYRDYRFIIAGAPARSMEDYSGYRCIRTGGEPDIRVIFGETQSIVRHSVAAVVNSGTASLETVLLGTPQVVGYICNRITYMIGRHVVKIKYISLGNLIADKPVFKELIQDECSAENLLSEIRALIENRQYRAEMLEGYAEIKKALGGTGASNAVAADMVRSTVRLRQVRSAL